MAVDPVSIGIKVALMAAQMALTASQRIKGPRLDSTDVSTADYGTPIVRFWGKRKFTPSIIWAEKLREVKTTSKTKGGKYDEYKYYATFAVLICDHEIDAVSRVWMDKHLVYQSADAGPVSAIGDFQVGDNMRVYLGTEDQNPDPRYVAWCEDRYGPDTAPAYRGSAYLVFEELPVEKFGNRVPQVTVEVVTSKTNSYPYEFKETTIGGGANARVINGTWMLNASGEYYPLEWWDLPTRTLLGVSAGGGGLVGNSTNIDIDPDGRASWYGTDGVRCIHYECLPLASVVETIVPDAPLGVAGPCRALPDSVWCGSKTPGYIKDNIFVTAAQCGRDFFVGPGNRAWGIFEPTGTSNQFTISDTLGIGSPATFTGAVTRSAPGNPKGCYLESANEFFVTVDGYWYRIDADTMTVLDTGVALFGEADLPGNRTNALTFYNGFSQYSLRDGSLIRTINPLSFVGEIPSTITVYDPFSNALISRGTGTHLTWRYLDRIGSDGIQLKDIVEDVSEWCGLEGIDATDLDQVITGYSVTQGSGKDMISPLLDIHDCDARPHDFSVQFKKRGQTSQGVLLTPDFVREGDSPRYSVTIAQDTDLPRRITLNYADEGKDQQTNTAQTTRPLDTMKSVREQQIDMTTYVSNPAEAQMFADRYFRRIWNEREEIKLGLTAQYLKIEPGDIWTVSLDGLTRNARCTKMTLTGGALQLDWVRDEQTLNAVINNSGPEMEGRDVDVIYVPGPTKGFVLDMPLINDSDNGANPLLYYAAGKYATTCWPGAAIYSVVGEDYDAFAAVDSASGATWGRTTNALATANPWLWDRGNSVNISLSNGTLVSVTEAAVDLDGSLNLAYLGGELLQFTTATLQGDGTYTLTGLKRGRRGTERFVGTHTTSEDFILASSLAHEEMSLNDVALAENYRAATIGREPTTGTPIAFTYTGATLKPYAPARVISSYDGTDWVFTVIRRTRVGGNWVGGGVIPLSENSEDYVIEIYSGAVLKETLTISGSNSVTWTSAQQTASFGSPQSTRPALVAYQISDTVGRGFALAA